MRRLEPGFCPISYGLVDLLDVQRPRDIPDKLKRPTSRHDSGESGRSGKPLQATREWLVLSERCFSQSPSRLLGSRRHTTLPLLISLVRCLLTRGTFPRHNRQSRLLAGASRAKHDRNWAYARAAVLPFSRRLDRESAQRGHLDNTIRHPGPGIDPKFRPSHRCQRRSRARWAARRPEVAC